MDHHIQCLGPDLVLLLCGNDGMLSAADQYCDDRAQLELSEYVDWIGQHGLRARMCMSPDVKGIFYRRNLVKIVQDINDRLQQLGVFIAEEEISQKDVNDLLQDEELDSIVDDLLEKRADAYRRLAE